MDEKAFASTSEQHVVQSTYIKPQARKLHDSDVTFEEYHYYALKTREEEKGLESPKMNWREIMLRKKKAHDAGESNGGHDPSKDHTEVNFANKENRIDICESLETLPLRLTYFGYGRNLC